MADKTASKKTVENHKTRIDDYAKNILDEFDLSQFKDYEVLWLSYYLLSFNASLAAKQCNLWKGEVCNQMGWRILHREHIQEVIQRFREKVLLTALEIKSRHSIIARFDMGEYFKRSKNGTIKLYKGAPIIDFDALDRDGMTGMIKEIRYGARRATIVFRDSDKSLEQMAQILGLVKNQPVSMEAIHDDPFTRMEELGEPPSVS